MAGSLPPASPNHTDRVPVAPGVEITRIGFGCASLMTLPSSRQRNRLLAAALDAGVSHFDVARMYGLGAAERELGTFLRRRPEATTVATKFGIDVPQLLQRLAPLQAPARAALRRLPHARAAVRRQNTAFHTPRQYDAAQARVSLDRSLTELGLDHVDILFVHDPHPTDVIHSDELVSFFHDAQAAGKIRAWGVSQDAHPGLDVAGSLGEDCIRQIRHDALGDRPAAPISIAFGVLGAAHRSISGWLLDDPGRLAEWQSALGVDLTSGDALGSLLLASVLEPSTAQAALYATTDPARLNVVSQLLHDPRPPGLPAFRTLIARDRAAIIASTSR